MKRIVVGAILAALTLVALSPLVEAKGTGKAGGAGKGKAAVGGSAAAAAAKGAAAGGKGGKKALGAYALRCGRALAGGGICYPGAAQSCWTLRYWSPTWRLWFLFDPNTGEWYYWHPRLRAYFPITQLLNRTPPVAPVNATANQALNTTVPMNVSNVPVANANNGPKNLPNAPRNLRANPLQ